MGETWLRGAGGAVMSFSGPLPPFIAAQLAKGDLTRVELPALPALPDPPEVLPVPAPEAAAEPEPAPALERPAPDAAKALWEAWAVAQGMSRSRAHKTPKADLARQYGLRAVG